VIVADVNILLYAVVTGYPQHDLARQWWEDTLNGEEQVGLALPALFGFIRVGTNPRALISPLSVESATTFISDWLDRPNVDVLMPGPRHVDIAIDLLRRLGTGRNLTTDAQLAALAIEHDGVVYSNDTDFARFPGLRWVNPLRRSKG
jgi:uncharacterized protein